MSSSEWLKEYYSRIIEEYKFSMERKDRVTDWSIGIFFISIVAYVELLRYQLPAIWRICMVVGLLCFTVRLFSSSCLAYAYLRKWRYLLDLIEEYWKTKAVSLDSLKEEIEKYHNTPRTVERRTYFMSHQLVGGFSLLFLFPSLILLFEIYSNLRDSIIIVPVLFLVGYCVYESVIFVRNKELSMPSGDAVPPVSRESVYDEMEKRRNHLDSLFEIALVLLGILSAAEFQYFLVIESVENYGYILKVFTIPFVVLIILWLVKELTRGEASLNLTMLLTEFCWEFWSFVLLYYLVNLYVNNPFGIWLALGLSLIVLFFVYLAYSKASPTKEGEILHDFYTEVKWRVARLLTAGLAYTFLLIIIVPSTGL